MNRSNAASRVRINAEGSTAFVDSISLHQAAESLNEISANSPTLRDYFAAKALGGMLSNEQCMPLGFNFSEAQMAERAYDMADAMIEARNK